MDIDEEHETLGGEGDAKAAKNPLTFNDIASNVLYITRGVELNQPRLLHRSIRQNYSIRRNADRELLSKVVSRYLPSDAPVRHTMMSFIEKLPGASLEETPDEEMEVDEIHPIVLSVLPEVEVYIFTLIVTSLLRANLAAEAAEASKIQIERIRTFNRRSLDIFSSKAIFYYSLAHERISQLDSIRPTLLLLYRTACIRHDEMGQAVLLNTLLRNYLAYNLIDQAHILSLRVTFPEQASNNQFCRYLYYLGRVQAIQLQYSEAYQRLTMAARKAPQGYALGFSRMVNKLIILVQLLMGDIPERSVFNTPELRASLVPYLMLTQAVRTGDVMQFNSVVEKCKAAFVQDHNYSLVQRLGHNVLKTGLRKISMSYSRISLQDIATKLHLPSAPAAEYICAKAIRDCVMEAKIDHENAWMTCQEVMDIYSTEEPQKAFHKRIAFCLDVHNEAVKSMRYPPDTSYPKKSGLGGDKDKDKTEEKTIDELIKELEEDFDE